MNTTLNVIITSNQKTKNQNFKSSQLRTLIKRSGLDINPKITLTNHFIQSNQVALPKGTNRIQAQNFSYATREKCFELMLAEVKPTDICCEIRSHVEDAERKQDFLAELLGYDSNIEKHGMDLLVTKDSFFDNDVEVKNQSVRHNNCTSKISGQGYFDSKTVDFTKYMNCYIMPAGFTNDHQLLFSPFVKPGVIPPKINMNSKGSKSFNHTMFDVDDIEGILITAESLEFFDREVRNLVVRDYLNKIATRLEQSTTCICIHIYNSKCFLFK